MDYEAALDQTPDAWLIRSGYAEWLQSQGMLAEASVQRWMIQNQKCPGPACLIEAAWHEATWFIESHAGHKWTFNYDYSGRIKAEWCLPTEIFAGTKGFITEGRRDKGHHNYFAKSWLGRRDAEAALVALAKTPKKMKLPRMRTLDAPWDQDEFEMPDLFKLT